MRGIVLAAAAMAFALSAVPALADESGTVNAKVAVASPCLAITNSLVLDFGTQAFTTATQPQHPGFGTGYVAIENCSAAQEQIHVRGTDATGATASWTLVKPPTSGATTCSQGTDKYFAITSALGNPLKVYLTTTNQPLVNATAAQKIDLQFEMQMPCTGSSGAGETMSFQYIYTASF